MKPFGILRTKSKAYPAQFSTWLNNGVTLTANSTTGPDGRLNATRIAETATTDYHFLKKNVGSYTSGVQYVMWAILKPYGTQQWVEMDDSFNSTVYFDIVNGVVGNTGSTIVNTKIVALAGGWFYCAAQFTNTGATSVFAIVTTGSNGGAVSYAGATTKGFYVWKSDCGPGILHNNVSGTAALVQNRSFEGATPFSGMNIEAISGGVTQSTTRYTHGSASAKCYINRNDVGYGGGSSPHRSEIHSNIDEYLFGVDYWVGLNVYLENWITDADAEQLIQWHNVPNFNAGETWGTLKLVTPLGIQIINGHWDISHAWINDGTPNGTISSTKVNAGNIADNAWTAWVIHFRPHYSTGILEIWKNGSLVYSKVGNVYYNDENGPYHKVGVYKWSWSLGYPGNAVSRTCYIDNWKISNDPGATYATVDPTL